ncbi:MAG TPA: FAD-dependent oxidoreductase, partial [Buttiauxella sp.]
MHYDLIIVGSGSVGAAAGCYATHSGLNVLMIDSCHPPHQQGSHHGDTRLMRHAYGEGEKYVPLVLRAQKLWDALQEISGEKVFHRTGVINLGPADSAFISTVQSSAQTWSLPLETLTADDVMTRWPQLTVPENYLGLFEPDSGVLRSELAVATYIRLANQGG